MTPQLVVLAGPNGAGKSTFYAVFLAESPLRVLNADNVAEATGIDSWQAARMLDAMREQLIDDGVGFITETVFSDPHGAKLAMLERAIAAGFDVVVVYIGVGSAELAERRVDARIALGGHDVPRDRIAARYVRSLDNLAKAIAFVPRVELYDNSSADEPYRHVATFEASALTWRMRGVVPAWARRFVPRRKKR